MSDASTRRLRRTLLHWFRRNGRRLPFRESWDPWRVWVSEVMLQQTRVEAMLPRYRTFLARFPDPASLAAAPEDEALAAWSGLGYYGRARALYRAAQELDGRIPETAAALRNLPGVGEYTAAAIASIAFGEPVAAVDGNARRVLARLFAVEGVPGRARFEREIRQLADRLMAADRACEPGAWNQAIMELGALVCTPAAPRCGACPLRRRCKARKEGRERELPGKRRRPAPVSVRLAQAVVRDPEGRLLLFRRRESPMRGLYELPGGPCRAGEPPEAAVVREAASRYGLRLSPGRALPAFRHTVMHRRITVFPFEARCEDRARGAGRWVRPAEVDQVPASSILHKTLARSPGAPPTPGAAGIRTSRNRAGRDATLDEFPA